jgi:hypothetical protein
MSRCKGIATLALLLSLLACACSGSRPKPTEPSLEPTGHIGVRVSGPQEACRSFLPAVKRVIRSAQIVKAREDEAHAYLCELRGSSGAIVADLIAPPRVAGRASQQRCVERWRFQAEPKLRRLGRAVTFDEPLGAVYYGTDFCLAVSAVTRQGTPTSLARSVGDAWVKTSVR